MKVGTFISDMVRNETYEPIEITFDVSKEFIDSVYKFMLLDEKAVRDVKKYFENKLYYKSGGMHFDPDMVEIFVEQHKK